MGTMVYSRTVSLTLWLGNSQLMITQSLSLLVKRMLTTLSGFSRSLLLIDTGLMILIFAIYRVVSSWLAVKLTWWWQTRSCDDGRTWHSRCVRWYSTVHFWSLLCQLYASRWAICIGIYCQKYCLSEASDQLHGTMSVVQSGALHEAPFWSQLIH